MMKHERKNVRPLGRMIAGLILLFLNAACFPAFAGAGKPAVSFADKPAVSFADKPAYRLEITAPSGPVTPGHDFFISGAISHEDPLPDGVRLRVSLIDEKGKEQRFALSGQKDHDAVHRFCDAFFYYADDVDPKRASVTAREFPCLIVDDEADPDASLRNANIKCWFSDTAFNSFIPCATDAAHGLLIDDGIGYTDEKGAPYDALPIGHYTAVVTLEDKDGRRLAGASRDFALAPAAEAVLCRFHPDEHYRRMMDFAAEKGLSMNIDDLPGYFRDPKGNDRGGLRAMFIGGDISLYNGSHVSMVEYLASPSSSSLVIELPFMEKYFNIDDPRVLTVYRYDIGEPYLETGRGPVSGRLVQVENGKRLCLCRADLAESPTEGVLDFKNLRIKDVDTDFSDGVHLRDDPDCRLAISGLVTPYQLKEHEILFNPARNETGLLNRVEDIVYIVRDGTETRRYQKPVTLTRRLADGSVYDSVMEFYHVFSRGEIDPRGEYTVTLYGIDKNGERVAGTDEAFLINRPGEVTTRFTPEGINKFGNISLEMSYADFKKSGFDEGDIITVHIGGREIDMPFCTDYQDVKRGKPFLAGTQKELALWVSMGSFAEVYNVAKREPAPDGEARWSLSNGRSEGTVTLNLKEKAGYLEDYELRRAMAAMKPAPSRRADQSEEEFANFREVTTTGIKRDTLFRSSSPINDRDGRNIAADRAMRAHGIDHIINLYDSREGALRMPGYEDTYVSTVDTAYIKVSLDYTSVRFKKNIADIMDYIAKSSGKYAVHCIIGEHRTGAVCVVLEALMGASYDEIVRDYMLSTDNLYGVKPGTKQYELLADDNVNAILQALFNVNEPKSADLQELAHDYVLSAGVTEDTLAKVKAHLGD